MSHDVGVSNITFHLEVAVIGREPLVHDCDHFDAALADDERAWGLLSSVPRVALDTYRKDRLSHVLIVSAQALYAMSPISADFRNSKNSVREKVHAWKGTGPPTTDGRRMPSFFPRETWTRLGGSLPRADEARIGDATPGGCRGDGRR